MLTSTISVVCWLQLFWPRQQWEDVTVFLDRAEERCWYHGMRHVTCFQVAFELLRQQYPKCPVAGSYPVVLVSQVLSAGGSGEEGFSHPHLYVHHQIYSIVKSRTEVDRQLDNAVKKKVKLLSQHFLVPDIPKGYPDFQAHRIRQR